MLVSRSDSDNLAELQMFGRQTFDRRHNRRASAHGRSPCNGPFDARLDWQQRRISRFLRELSQGGRVLRLTLLALEIVEAILDGRQPGEATLAVLIERISGLSRCGATTRANRAGRPIYCLTMPSACTS